MTTIGLCTHLCETDDWAFDYALKLVKTHDWQLNICHWLPSPYRLRRDMIPDDLFHPVHSIPANPQLLAQLELQLRQYYDDRLGDFTNVAFKLCEGMYQVEMVRCFRQHLLDLVIMGYLPQHTLEPDAKPVDEFSLYLAYPLVIVGHQGPNTFLLNPKAAEWLEKLDLPIGQWQILEPQLIVHA
jgi:hypothetical protein